jgi:hypothetical protein
VLAAIIAVLPTSLLMQMRCFFRILDLHWRQAFRSLSVLLLKASVPIGVGLLVRSFWAPNGLIEFIIFGAFYSVFAFVFYCFTDNDLQQFIIKGFNKFVGKNKTLPHVF